MLTVSCERQIVETENFDGMDKKLSSNIRVKHQAEVRLTDGSIIQYPSGFQAVSDTIITTGYMIDPTSADTLIVNRVPLQEVRSIEKTRYEFTKTAKIIFYTVAGTFIAGRLLAIMFDGVFATGS